MALNADYLELERLALSLLRNTAAVPTSPVPSSSRVVGSGAVVAPPGILGTFPARIFVDWIDALSAVKLPDTTLKLAPFALTAAKLESVNDNGIPPIIDVPGTEAPKPALNAMRSARA